jgi:hypothetical protein
MLVNNGDAIIDYYATLRVNDLKHWGLGLKNALFDLAFKDTLYQAAKKQSDARSSEKGSRLDKAKKALVKAKLVCKEKYNLFVTCARLTRDNHVQNIERPASWESFASRTPLDALNAVEDWIDSISAACVSSTSSSSSSSSSSMEDDRRRLQKRYIY